MSAQVKPTGYIIIGYLNPIFEYLRRQDEPLAPYLQLLGLSEDDLLDVDRQLPDEALVKLLSQVAQRHADQHIGFRIGQTIQAHQLGIVGLLAMSCGQAREAFELQSRYQSLIGSALQTTVETLGDLILLTVRPQSRSRDGDHFGYEYLLGILLRMLDLMRGQGCAPQQIEMPCAAPRGAADLSALLNCPVRYGHDSMKLSFKGLDDAPCRPAVDAGLRKTLIAQANQRLRSLIGARAHADPVIEDIFEMITDRLPHGPPGVEEIAERMGVSVRKLQRMLSSQELNYKALLDQRRCELAETHVRNRDLSLTDVAMMLGFSEQSSFSRAFKRWFGNYPSEYRRQIGQAAS